ncbi:MAG: ParA family protein [Ekhidna sp.]|nr:ParA family protein [Ekhidna sp.]MBC6409512.1 ParA family protein [Ekhidna sp.]
MPIISVVNQKGGTGKTTTTLNLSSALAKLGKNVLAIDMDSQGNLGYSLGLESETTIVDVLEDTNRISDVLLESEGFSIVISDMRLVDVELALGEMDDRHSVLSKKLKSLESSYDYILVDCPPSLSILALNALYASEYVIIPMLMEVLSLQGLDQIIETIEKINASYNKELQILGILPVMVDKRRKLSGEIREYIKENYDLRIFKSMIRNNVKASESPSFGKSVVEYAPNSNSAVDYKAFATEITRLI